MIIANITWSRGKNMIASKDERKAQMEIFDNSLAIKSNAPRHINGITCDVHNCVYHDGDNYCTADRVNIGNAAAVKCGETRCATFEMRGEITRK